MIAAGFDPDDQRRVNELFHRALELPPSAWAEFLRRECPDSPEIAAEVLSLLEAGQNAKQFLSVPLKDSDALANDPMIGRIGQTVGQYRLDGILGRGGMGVVYLAFDERLNIFVALKAISPDVTRDPARRERLRREAQIVARLKHQNVAWIYALEEFNGELFIASELIEGETLREQIGRGPASPQLVLDTAIQLAGALASAHDQGIIHRDLKPENVMREPTGRVRILDFGLAQMRDATPRRANLTIEGKLFGTPGYMSPEQIRREPLDGRSDLFSLGILLFELLTDTHPFGGSDQASTIAAILEKNPPPRRVTGEAKSASGSLASSLDTAIRKLLCKQPEGRFASAHQLRDTLERLRSGDHNPDALSSSGGRLDAVRLWNFHQAATCAYYVLLLIPLSIARSWDNGHIGPWYFVAAIAAVVGAIMLRTHLWFAASRMPGEFAHQHRSNWKWVRGADVVLVAAAELTGLALFIADPTKSGHSVVAVLAITGGVLLLISSLVIEPATRRAAFGWE